MAHLKVVIDILNEMVDGKLQSPSVTKELVFWDGLGSDIVAVQLRMMMLPFSKSENVSIRIFRNVERPFDSIDYPEVQYMIWDLRATADGIPVVIGRIMIHKTYPERKSLPFIHYTQMGARKAQHYLQKLRSASR